jgi:hypothetical protein
MQLHMIFQGMSISEGALAGLALKTIPIFWIMYLQSGSISR